MIQFENGKASLNPESLKQLNQDWLQVLKRKEVGFPRITERDEDWIAIEKRVAAARPARRALILGIGGSSLGTQVIYQSFRDRSAIQLHFLESPDPHTWQSLNGFKGEEWKDKYIIIVSKSGNTLETLAWVEQISAHDPQWLKHSQVTVIASPGEGPLQKWARANEIQTLTIPSEVGGRFSVLTAVSMLPAALMGLSLGEFREGARWALAHTELASQLSCEILEGWKRGEWITQMWSYSESLRIFGEWWQQLWGESLAKKLDRKGQPAARVSTPMACVGPRDQHSLVQQLMEGAKDKQIFINRVASLEHAGQSFKPSIFSGMPFYNREVSLGAIVGAEAQAFAQALKEYGINSSTLTVQAIDERSLGALFMLWQMVIAQLGEHLGIDTFNQPGVELGKVYATKILAAK